MFKCEDIQWYFLVKFYLFESDLTWHEIGVLRPTVVHTNELEIDRVPMTVMTVMIMTMMKMITDEYLCEDNKKSVDAFEQREKLFGLPEFPNESGLPFRIVPQ